MRERLACNVMCHIAVAGPERTGGADAQGWLVEENDRGPCVCPPACMYIYRGGSGVCKTSTMESKKQTETPARVQADTT